MEKNSTSIGWLNVFFILCLLLPVLVLLMMPGGTMMGGFLFLPIVLLLCFWMIASMAAVARGEQQEETDHTVDDGIRMIPDGEQPDPIRAVMDVRVATQQHGAGIFRGRLTVPADEALVRRQSGLGENTVPMIQPDEELGTAIVLMNRPTDDAVLERPTRPWLHWLLFDLTFLTTTWAGALHQGVNLLEQPSEIAVGLWYSVGLLLILGVHELGHYFMARHHGLNVSPPFFIPVPFPLGTFGAFIQMKSPTRNRRALFDVAVAGPLAGLVVAIPALLIGLQTTQVLPSDAEPASEMNCLHIVKRSFGDELRSSIETTRMRTSRRTRESEFAIDSVTRVDRENQGVVGCKESPEASRFASGDSLTFIAATDRRLESLPTDGN